METLLNGVRDKHPLFEFLRILSIKWSFNIFGSEHLLQILLDLSSKTVENKHLEASLVNLLMNVVSVCPSLLRGSEDQLGMLLSEEEHPYFDKLLQILVKASRKAIELSAIYPFLERACLEGTRLQSKYAIFAISAFGGASSQAFSSLCKKLVDSLCARRNISTVLQSLGCIAQYSVSMFESREKEIKRIIQTIFHETNVQLSDDHPVLDLDSGCSTSCRLKGGTRS